MFAFRRSTAVLLGAASLLSACGSPDSSEQPPIVTSISGLVYDTDTTSPIGMALVETEPATQGVTTNSDGRYVISSGVLPGTTYRISASRSGYQSASRQVSVGEGTNANVDIGLAALSGQLWVDPQTISFKIAGEGKENKTFSLQNKGDGLVDYTITATLPDWMTLASSAGTTNGGSLDKAETHTITVGADASRLPGATGTDATVINVTSKAGNAAVTVKLEKVSAACFSLGFQPGTNIDFGADASSTVKLLHIQNTGGGPMKWAATQVSAWLSIGPSQGSIDAAGSTDVTLLLDRTKLQSGVQTTEVTVIASAGDGNPDCKEETQIVHVAATNTSGCACTSGNVRCASDSEDPTGKTIHVCKDDCSGEYESACPSNQYCGQDPKDNKQKCLPQVCTPNQYKCKDNTAVRLCNAKGSAYEPEKQCKPGEWCYWSDVAQHDDCVCKKNCEFNGVPKQCGLDGCGEPCTAGCDPNNEVCIDPPGVCQPMTAAEKSCDLSQPHGTLLNAPICVAGAMISSATPAKSNGCFSSSSGYCLVADTFDACGPGNSNNDVTAPDHTGISSASYRIEYTIVVR